MKRLFWTALFVFGFAILARADSFYSDLTLLGQGRENQNGQNELPLNTYLGMGGSLPEKRFSARTNLRVFRDFERSLDEVDLYQAVFHLRPADALSLDTGRQFIGEGFAAEIIDGIRAQIKPDDFFLETTLYSGIPRNDEIGDFNQNDGLVSGVVFRLFPSAPFHFSTQARWQKVDMTAADWRENDKVLAGANFSCGWGENGDLLYGLWEYDTTARLTETGTLGFFLSPAARISFNLEGNYFNIDDRSTQNTIFNTFAEGPTLGGRFASTLVLMPRKLEWLNSYAYQRVEIQADVFRHAHLASTSLAFTFPAAGLYVEPGYNFQKSFGGRLHGGHLFARQEITPRWYFSVHFNAAKYNKVTNDNDEAYSAISWTGYEIFKGWMLAAGAEYNKNNVFNNEYRGTFKLEWHYDYNKS